MKKIRALKPDEVEVMPKLITEKGCQLLLYKDSRCDRKILDEVFGVLGWRNSFQMIGDTLFCTIEVWDDEKKQWIAKSDCGTEGNIEKEKSEASDAFKRAASALGIGRELYTKIFIWAGVETERNEKGKFVIKDKRQRFSVRQMIVNEERQKIEGLEIVDKDDHPVFAWGKIKVYCRNCNKVLSKEEIAKRKDDKYGNICDTCLDSSDWKIGKKK